MNDAVHGPEAEKFAHYAEMASRLWINAGEMPSSLAMERML
jgi:hypothetical protein